MAGAGCSGTSDNAIKKANRFSRQAWADALSHSDTRSPGDGPDIRPDEAKKAVFPDSDLGRDLAP